MELSEHSSPARPPAPGEARGRTGWNLVTTPAALLGLFVASLLALQQGLWAVGYGSTAPMLLFATTAAALTLVVWLKSPRALRRVAAVAGLVLIGLQFTEHRVYGATRFADNRSVMSTGGRVVAIEAPNVFVTEDGARFDLGVFHLTQAALALTPAQVAERLDVGRNLVVGTTTRYGDIFADNPMVETPVRWSYPDRLAEPRLLPHTLPRYMPQDLTSALFGVGLVLSPQDRVTGSSSRPQR